MRNSCDARISFDIAAILKTDIHSSGHAIRNLLAAQGRGI